MSRLLTKRKLDYWTTNVGSRDLCCCVAWWSSEDEEGAARDGGCFLVVRFGEREARAAMWEALEDAGVEIDKAQIEATKSDRGKVYDSEEWSEMRQAKRKGECLSAPPTETMNLHPPRHKVKPQGVDYRALRAALPSVEDYSKMLRSLEGMIT